MNPLTTSLLSQANPNAAPPVTQQATPVQAAPVQTASQPSKPNFFERLLPTIGSIGAWGLGTALAPETGGLSLVGAGLLSGLGGAAGKAVENVATHNNATSGLLGAGLTNAIGGAAGQGLSGLLGAGGGLLSDLGGKYASKEAAAAGEQAISDAFPDAALNANARTALNFGKSLDLADQVGIDKTPEAFTKAAGAATGSNGVMNGTLDSIVTGAGPVNMAKYGDVVNGALNDNVGQLGSLGEANAGYRAAGNAAQRLQQTFENDLQQTAYGGSGSLTANADPEGALTLMRNIGQQAQRYAGSAAGSNDAAIGDVYNKVYQGLKDIVYNRPDVNQAVSDLKLAPEDEAAVLKATGGNQQLADYITNTMNNAKRASDITKVESQFADMGTAGQKALDYVNNAVGTGKSAQLAADAARVPIPELPTSTAGLGAKAINLAAKGGSKSLGVGGGLLNGLNAYGGILPVSAMLGASNLKNDIAPPQTNLPTTTTSNNIGGTMSPTTQAPNIFQSMIPGSGVSQAYEPQALQAILGMFDPQALNSTIENNANTSAQDITKVNAAAAQLPELQQLFQQAGGAQGPAGGLLSTLGAKLFGGAAGTYGSQAQQILDQISKNTGIPSSELVAPQITQSPTSANAALVNIQNLLRALGATGSNQSLLSATAS